MHQKWMVFCVRVIRMSDAGANMVIVMLELSWLFDRVTDVNSFSYRPAHILSWLQRTDGWTDRPTDRHSKV